MSQGSSLSPLIIKYENVLEKDPRSRVFAPLAEGYRKLGLIEKAMEVLQKGIRFNPDYLMGYLGLASCYFDLEQYQMAYSTLRPIVGLNRDNIKLQRLFGETCLKVDQKEEALDTFKYLLFLNAKDQQAIEMVYTLESEIKEILIDHVENEDPIKFEIDNIDSSPLSIDDQINQWIQVDLTKEGEDEEPRQEDNIVQVDDWNLAKPEDEVYQEEVECEDEETEEVFSAEEIDATPVMTHTLVDLYVKQGHFQKAFDVLEKINELQPGNEQTLAKIEEVKSLLEPDVEVENNEENSQAPISENQGREELMSLFDQQVGTEESQPKTDEVSERLWAWHEALCQRAKEHNIDS